MYPVKFLFRLIEKYTYLIVIGLPLFVLILLLLSYDKFQIEGALRGWFTEDAASIVEYDQFIENFGSDNQLIVVVHNPEGIINPKSIESVRRITRGLLKTRHIIKAYSLINFPHVGVNPDDSSEIVIDRLIPSSAILTPKVLALLEKKLEGARDIKNRLISTDLKTTVILGKISDRTNDENSLYQVVADVKKIIEEERKITGLHYVIHGNPILSLGFMEIAKEEIIRFTPIVFGITLLLLMAAFRSLYAALIPLIVVVMTTVTVMAVYVMLGFTLNNFTATIPVFILAIGIADSVHIYWIWRLHRQHDYSNASSIAFSLQKNVFPALLTTLTTFIGFSTLIVSDVVPIQTLGIAIALSSIVAFVYSTLYVPAFLAWINPAIKQRYNAPEDGLLCRRRVYYERYVSLVLKHYRLIISGSFIMTLLMAAGIAFVRIDTNTIRMFHPDMPIRTDFNFIQKNITGPMNLEIMIDTKEQGGVYNPVLLSHVDDFSSDLRMHNKAFRHIFSIVDLLKRMHMIFNENNLSYYDIPAHQDEVEQYFAMYSFSLPQGLALSDHIDMDERFLRLSVQMNAIGSEESLGYIQWIESWWIQQGYVATVNGKIALSTYLHSEVARTMLYSIALNLSIVSILFFILFRKISLVFIALIPNIIPLISVIGMMGWMSMSIDMGLITSIVILLGVAMDATIYFIVKYRSAMLKGKSLHDALVYMLTYAGIANILSTFILIISFGIFIFSHFMPNMQFGFITVFALVISLLTDLLLLPSLLVLWQKYSRASSLTKC